MSKPRVLMIFGFPRSGSTVMGLLVQERVGAAFCGELNNFWKRYVRGRPCSCGLPLSECPTWSAVAERVLAEGPGFHTAEEAAAVQTEEADRLAPRHRDAYGPHLAALYVEMSRVFGTELVVDSSKGVGDARLVRELDEVEPWFLYLVRDPRGTAYSRSRGRTEHLTGSTGRRSRIEGWDDYWLARDGLEWSRMDRQAASLLTRVPHARHRTVRYEDFVAAPEETLDALVDWLGGPLASSGVAGGEAHVLGGNQGVLRSQGTQVTVHADERWRSGLRPYKRRLLEAVTVRGRRRHSYR